MKQAIFEYRCRRCHTVDRNPRCGLPNGDTYAILQLVNATLGTPSEPQSPTLVSTHLCLDGGHGITDLIGCSIIE